MDNQESLLSGAVRMLSRIVEELQATRHALCRMEASISAKAEAARPPAGLCWIDESLLKSLLATRPPADRGRRRRMRTVYRRYQGKP